jgi:hypothetical protein
LIAVYGERVRLALGHCGPAMAERLMAALGS